MVIAQVGYEDPFLFPQYQGGLRPLQARRQDAGLVVPIRENLIIEKDHQQSEQESGYQHRPQKRPKAHSAGFGRDDFPVGGEAGKGHEYGDEHGHGHGQRHDPS